MTAPGIDACRQIAADGFHAALLDDDAAKLYEQAPCGYLSTLPDGTIVKANQTFLALTGYRADALIGTRAFADLLTVGGRIYHETHYSPTLRMQGRTREIAFDIVRADGSRLPVLVNSVLERDDAGAEVAIRVAVFDATERREYERELLRAKERAEESEARASALARTLQQTLIPPSPPKIAGLDLGAVYRPAGRGDEVGGDFYDIFEIGPGDWVVAIGDVRGKGVDAAVVTALVRHSIRAMSVRSQLPSEVLSMVNAVLLRDGTDRFCTVAIARLRSGWSGSAGGWEVTISAGGHGLPLLVGPEGSVGEVGAPGSLVGAFHDAAFADVVITLKPGQSLVFYTDGVIEGRRGRDFYGEQRMVAALARGAPDAQTLADGLVADVLEFQSGNARDDIAVVVVGVLPTAAGSDGGVKA